MNNTGQNPPDMKAETPSSSDLLNRLCNWYQSQCDGEWEHAFGVDIGTLDNPGWTLDVDLDDTYLKRTCFQPIDDGFNDDDNHDEEGNAIGPWLFCYVVNKKFLGSCDPLQLPRLLSIFLDWADANRPADSADNSG